MRSSHGGDGTVIVPDPPRELRPPSPRDRSVGGHDLAVVAGIQALVGASIDRRIDELDVTVAEEMADAPAGMETRRTPKQVSGLG
jgi:hypothetical protein